MNKAAAPARYGSASRRDESHPRFPLYRQHRSACSRLMVDCESFHDWLACYERDLQRANAASDPRYSRFLDWMIAAQAGARKCPAGTFPHNFYFWLDGGRW